MHAIEAVAEIVGIVDLELFVRQVGRLRAWDYDNQKDADEPPED